MPKEKYYDVVTIKDYSDIDNGSFSVFGKEWAESEEHAIQRVKDAYEYYRWGYCEIFYVALTKVCECCGQTVDIDREVWQTEENWKKFKEGRK